MAAPINQPQSPAKPAPAWLKLIDYGTVDPKLKGHRLPEGFKLEVVADAPAVINPVGMTFADDGTPLPLGNDGGQVGPGQLHAKTLSHASRDLGRCNRIAP